MTKRTIAVSVRELVEFVCHTGDLGGRGDFVGANRALDGTRGHQRIQKSRPEGYAKEVALVRRIHGRGFDLEIKGRIDGVMRTENSVWLEEIKTVAGTWDGLADPLHWAQGKLYAAILAEQEKLQRIEVRLTYLELDSNHVTTLSEAFSAAELQAFFTRITGDYVAWLEDWHRGCELRDASIDRLAFPFRQYRPGQRSLAVAAYQTLSRGGRLFAEAPTGIGKTISMLFPAVKAMREGKFTHLFYLTAKTSGRAVAEQAIADLRKGGLRLRAITLTARDKICFGEKKPCEAVECPFALGYFDRVKPAMREALQREFLTREGIEELAHRHQVCPFEFSLDCARWVDLIVCDFNHVFDPSAKLRRFFGDGGGDYAFLIDEAHNLVDRAREMFSAELNSMQLMELRLSLERKLPPCARALKRAEAALRDFARVASGGSPDPSGFSIATSNDSAGVTRGPLPNSSGFNITATNDFAGVTNGTSQHLPEEFLGVLQKFMDEAGRWLARNLRAPFREALLQLYFEVQRFLRTAAGFDENYAVMCEVSPGNSIVRLFCLDPSRLLAEGLAQGRAAVFFSGTLSPLDYFCRLLGGAQGDVKLQVPSPFPPEHLRVLVEDRIRTDFKSRDASTEEVAAAIAALVRARVGNYLVFFPSYRYLEAVLPGVKARLVDAAILVQRSRMTEDEQDEFLQAFRGEPTGTHLGFAVMGGLFGEGIDLVGERLIGAVVVGVGLPQLCPERDLIRQHFAAEGRDGFAFAYRFPGMNRVLQAVGRVIRTETDRGVVLLIDARYRDPNYSRLLPPHWLVRRPATVSEIGEAAVAFWNDADQRPA